MKPGLRADARVLTAGEVAWLLMACLAGQVLFAGLTSRLPRGTFDREWLARVSGYHILAAIVWLLAAGTVLYRHEILKGTTSYIAGSAAASGTLIVAAGLSHFTKATTAAAVVKERLPVSMMKQFAALFPSHGRSAERPGGVRR